MGLATGLIFNFEQITNAPNTLLSHALINLAPATVRDAVIEDVYAAYFEFGQDIGDLETLVEIGAGQGMERVDLRGPIDGGRRACAGRSRCALGPAAPRHQRCAVLRD
jgi:predicted DsbA family dithiol-disulfide isomerase